MKINSSSSNTTAKNAPAGGSYPHFPGLHGLRAIAVTAVLIYHLFPSALPGGFLGVDIFFCISGFLITSLLLREHTLKGRINMPGFWRRRARRLLPALAVTLAVSATLGGIIGGDILINLKEQLIFSALFAANWFYIIAGSNYFTQDAPELFRNTWSLGVEEQFYLLLPILLLILLKKRASKKVFLATFLLLGGISVLTMSILSAHEASVSRIYFGSDSHSFGLFLGAALATLLHRSVSQTIKTPSWYAQIVYALGTLGGLIVILIMILTLQEGSKESFQGGILITSFATLGVIACATNHKSLPGRLLDNRIFSYIGERSYGIYLWHWPLLLICAAALSKISPSAPQWLAAVSALLATAAASLLSYRHIEQPIRRHGFRNSIAKFLAGFNAKATSSRRRITVALSALMLLSLAGTGYALAHQPAKTSSELAIERGANALKDQQPAETAPPAPADPPANDEPAPITGDQVSAIGDSVMLASAGELQSALPGIYIDAAVSRHMSTGLDIIEQLQQAGELRRYLVVALATNGHISDSDIDRLAALAKDHKIVVVNAHADRSWIPDVQQRLQHFAKLRYGVTLADWDSAIADHPDKLAGDDIHPDQEGAQIYADTVVSALQQLLSDAEQPANYQVPYLPEAQPAESFIIPEQ